MLDYKWQVIRATDYLEYERSGERNIMQNPYEANRKAINVLMMAELAEGKGRFIDQLINGPTYKRSILQLRNDIMGTVGTLTKTKHQTLYAGLARTNH